LEFQVYEDINSASVISGTGNSISADI